RIIHLITLRDELARGIAGMAKAETVIEGVVDDLDLFRRNLKQALGVFLGEIGYGEDAGSAMQHPFGELKMQPAFQGGLAVHAVEVIEQIMHRDHVGARYALRLPEQMRHMQQAAAIQLEDTMQNGCDLLHVPHLFWK